MLLAWSGELGRGSFHSNASSSSRWPLEVAFSISCMAERNVHALAPVLDIRDGADDAPVAKSGPHAFLWIDVERAPYAPVGRQSVR